MGIKTVTTNCELPLLCPKKESAVCFRPIDTKAELLKLKDVALLPQNISTVDNRRPARRNISDSNGLSLENRNMDTQKSSAETSAEHVVDA